MTEKQDSPDAEDTTPSGSATLPQPPQPLRPSCERLSCHKSSVCSRSYFVVVMVFFHVYIINVIALLLYVHYSNGQADASRGPGAPSSDHQRPESGSSPSKPEFLRDVPLTRIEGIRVSNVMMPFTRFYSLTDTPSATDSLLTLSCQVGHVQKVSLVPGRVHDMRTLSLKPLLFGKSHSTHTA